MVTEKIVQTTLPGRFFLGWKVVAALFIGGFLLYGGGVYAFILFVPPLAHEFHWGSASAGSLVSAFWISAPLSLFAAPLIRKFGTKRLAITGIVVEGVSLMVLFTASSLWQMYLLRAAAGLGKVLFAVTLPIILSKWFSRRFGLAAAIMYSGWHVGGLCLAPATEFLLTTIGWRATSVALGVTQLAIAVPVTLWGLRLASAADAGLGLDGGPPTKVESRNLSESTCAPAAEAGYLELLRELFMVRAFQLIMVATPFYYLVYGGVLLQQAAVIQGSGASAYAASLAVGVTAGCAALGAILGGWAFDRYSQACGTVVAFFLLGMGVLLLWAVTLLPASLILWLHAAIFGLGVGCGDIYWITLIKRRVPGSLFASAFGVWYFLQLVFLILAPAVSGAIFDLTRSYPHMLEFEIAVLAIPFLLMLMMVYLGPDLPPEDGPTNVTATRRSAQVREDTAAILLSPMGHARADGASETSYRLRH